MKPPAAKIQPAGATDVVQRFSAPDGLYAFGDLTVGWDGNLYGVMSDITLTPAADGNWGSVFRLRRLPTIRSIEMGGGEVILTWDSQLEGWYGVDGTLTLDPPEWTEYSNLILSTGLTHAASVGLVGEDQGYYRVVQLP